MLVVLVDDLRSFAKLPDARLEVARTSSEGVSLLESLRGEHIDELWLDHDLGGIDTIWPVVSVLEEAAFHGAHVSVGQVLVHSANPSGSAKVVQVLTHWGYQVRQVQAAPTLVYL